MQKFIRSKITNEFLTAEGGWTCNIAEAWKPETHIDAVAAKERLQLRDVELYYSFQDETPSSRFDFSVEL